MGQEKSVHVVIVMGVSGSGKSTVGEQLAEEIGGEFFDADDFHPRANVEKMASGEPLNDSDRAPWLDRLRDEIVLGRRGELSVLACSALKKSYREILGGSGVVWVYLHGSRGLLEGRLAGREGHFMKAEMLNGQLADLEVPSREEAMIVDISKSPDVIIEEVVAWLPILK